LAVLFSLRVSVFFVAVVALVVSMLKFILMVFVLFLLGIIPVVLPSAWTYPCSPKTTLGIEQCHTIVCILKHSDFLHPQKGPIHALAEEATTAFTQEATTFTGKASNGPFLLLFLFPSRSSDYERIPEASRIMRWIGPPPPSSFSYGCFSHCSDKCFTYCVTCNLAPSALSLACTFFLLCLSFAPYLLDRIL